MQRIHVGRSLLSVIVLILMSLDAGAQGANVANKRVSAIPLPGTGHLDASSTTSFTFFVAGDNRPANDTSPQTSTPAAIFAAAKAKKPSFIVWTGDMIYGLDSAHKQRISKQYAAFLALAKAGSTPVFAAPGNHEINVKIKHDSTRKEAPSAVMQAIYRANMGLSAVAPLYQSFTYGNSRFILVDTEEPAPPAAPRSPGAVVAGGKVNLDPGYVSTAQYDWIRSQLDSSTSAAHVFFFMHHPIKPKKRTMGLDSASAAKLVKLFAKYRNLSYVFQSHEHLYYNLQTRDESPPAARKDPAGAPWYLISGGAGAPLDKCAFFNYLEVKVRADSVIPSMHRLATPTDSSCGKKNDN